MRQVVLDQLEALGLKAMRQALERQLQAGTHADYSFEDRLCELIEYERVQGLLGPVGKEWQIASGCTSPREILEECGRAMRFDAEFGRQTRFALGSANCLGSCLRIPTIPFTNSKVIRSLIPTESVQ